MAPEMDPRNDLESDGVVRRLDRPERLTAALREQDRITGRRRGRRIWLDERDRILSA